MHRLNFVSMLGGHREKKESAKPVKETIDQILGISVSDIGHEGRHSDFSHDHLCGALPIGTMDWESFFMVVANYDKDRDYADQFYLQPGHDESDITLLLDKLAARGICLLNTSKIITDFNGEPGIPRQDLAVLLHKVSISKYLTVHEGMQAFLKLGSNLLAESYKHQPEVNDAPRPHGMR